MGARMNLNALKSENLTWLFMTVAVKMFDGFETRKGTLYLALDEGALTIQMDKGEVQVQNLQSAVVRTLNYPSKIGRKWSEIRSFVPTVFEGLVPRSYMADIERICTHFHPSKFYLLKRDGLYLQNALTNEWAKGKTVALRVSIFNRHAIVDWLTEKDIPVEEIEWIGVDTNPKKNLFAIDK